MPTSARGVSSDTMGFAWCKVPFRPFLKFLPIARILTGAVFFIHTVGAHGPPFVMITFEPYLLEVVEPVIICDIGRVQMTMVINDGCFAACS